MSAKLSDGPERAFYIGARCRALRIANVPNAVAASVKIAGVRFDLAVGRARSISIKANARAAGQPQEVAAGESLHRRRAGSWGGRTEHRIMPEPRDLLSAYREKVNGLRRAAGPAGALFSPLEVTAELLEQLLGRQQDLETQLNATLQPLRAMSGLARDAPAALRAQARAFEAASASFDQAAQVMHVQADLLERAVAALDVPAGLLRSVRPPGKDAPPTS